MEIHTQVKNIFLGIFVFFILGSFFILIKNRSENIILTIGDKKVQAIVSDTNKKREEGLSVMSSLSEDRAMIFIFDSNDIHSFWMKGMKFNIDIVWLDENKKIVYIKEHAKVSDYPDVYTPNKESRYVIEFVDGFVENNNLKIGDKLEW